MSTQKIFQRTPHFADWFRYGSQHILCARWVTQL